MAISENSRYANEPIVRVTDAKGVTRPTLYATPIASQPVSYRYYRLAADERFDQLAFKLWGDPKLWWILANLNPEITTPEDIPAGTVIRMPA